ncbi:hypothetical protein Ahy_A03g012009 isoform C [Arachis hypogaea]|uniref:Uncharacterized protein n=1 Tax=Arachis hypogaea TaxID=3818 RepID=A0A445DS97_ARAHY|nr:hypothetical protein Ahy_A03g012009 isoform C [Arachis hypogaea]
MPDVSEATHESMSVKEPASQGSAQLVEEEVQQKMVPAEADFQWKTPHDLGAENYMMPMGPAPGYSSYWNGMQPCMEGFMGPYGGPMQMMGYGLGPLDMPFAGGLPHDPFGMRGYMMPVVPPHRDLAAEYGMGMNVPPPVMSREEFEARKADRWRKHENEKRIDRDFSKDRDFGREASSSGDVPMKSKTHLQVVSTTILNPIVTVIGLNHRWSLHILSREKLPPRPIKRKADYHVDREWECERDHDHDRDRDQRDHRDRERGHHHHRHSSRMSSEPVTKTSSTALSSAVARDRKQKASVFSRISFPAEEEMTKKRKISAFPTTEAASTGPPATSSAHLKAASKGYYEGRAARFLNMSPVMMSGISN